MNAMSALAIRSNRRRGGSAMVAIVVAVAICGAISAAVVTTNAGRQRQASTELAREKAFHLAEAGVDWGITQIRILHGDVPSSPTHQTMPKAGTFTVRYTQGDANGLDDDGDGVVDNVKEHDYASLLSTGESGPVKRSLEVLMRKAVQIPTFDAAVQINVEAPVISLKGNSFTINGGDHKLDGTADLSLPSKYGIASPADVPYVTAQVSSMYYNQITGTGSNPSVGKVAPIDLSLLMQQASQAASVYVSPGTHGMLQLGTPVEGSTVTAYCPGNLKLSGIASGAGVLAIDGDLDISGSFLWTGIVLVRGRVTFTGGGSTKRIIGALCVGEEVDQGGGSDVTVTGTVDLWYSSAAVSLAAEALSTMVVMTWREAGNP